MKGLSMTFTITDPSKKVPLGRVYETESKKLSVDFYYPRLEGLDSDETTTSRLRVGLTCVRASKSIDIRYDYHRDGWVILSDVSVEDITLDDKIDDLVEIAKSRDVEVIDNSIYIEAAFIPAWVTEFNGKELTEVKESLDLKEKQPRKSFSKHLKTLWHKLNKSK
jgi:hypothetical protein